MRMLSVFIPESYIESLDILVAEEIFPNRSEAIRSAIRDLIRNEILLKDAVTKRKNKKQFEKQSNQEQN
ncbi:ribbon-helix-helix domain-containing protein [Promethearchaeum syntrophicum]|uniref:Ribbon-helix-helix domain-containing protein n=1 Tax=Promethearchaeum syntrophicum TaxID=2594042 RepID=A0A5B9D9L7_9ARCH|nr:ribbon-helix-helix domain-containing protein [Candidatus Prometheoarchaeum syntrophicum]QEE15783.1 Putative nickel-responsive regulator [Candidatus Prometheoarchaeum syntrophicum]